MRRAACGVRREAWGVRPRPEAVAGVLLQSVTGTPTRFMLEVLYQRAMQAKKQKQKLANLNTTCKAKQHKLDDTVLVPVLPVVSTAG